MNEFATRNRHTKPTAKQLRLKAMRDAVLADWRQRWPEAFTRPVPLAVGISQQIKEVLEAGDQSVKWMAVWRAMHHWTNSRAYLHGLARGEMRRNLDGTEAGLPSDDQRKEAQRRLDEIAARITKKSADEANSGTSAK
jgi:sRNA-binding protein